MNSLAGIRLAKRAKSENQPTSAQQASIQNMLCWSQGDTWNRITCTASTIPHNTEQLAIHIIQTWSCRENRGARKLKLDALLGSRQSYLLVTDSVDHFHDLPPLRWLNLFRPTTDMTSLACGVCRMIIALNIPPFYTGT